MGQFLWALFFLPGIKTKKGPLPGLSDNLAFFYAHLIPSLLTHPKKFLFQVNNSFLFLTCKREKVNKNEIFREIKNPRRSRGENFFNGCPLMGAPTTYS